MKERWTIYAYSAISFHLRPSIRISRLQIKYNRFAGILVHLNDKSVSSSAICAMVIITTSKFYRKFNLMDDIISKRPNYTQFIGRCAI